MAVGTYSTELDGGLGRYEGLLLEGGANSKIYGIL